MSGGVGLIGSFVSEIDFDANDSVGTGTDGIAGDGTVGTAGVDFLTTSSASSNFVATFTSAGAPVKVAGRRRGNGHPPRGRLESQPGRFRGLRCDLRKGHWRHLDGDNSLGGGLDIVVAKINATTGAVMWGKQFGGTGDQLCQSVAMDNSGNVIIAGGYNGTLQFGTLAAFPTVSGSTSSLLYVATLDGGTGTPTAASTWGTRARSVRSPSPSMRATTSSWPAAWVRT